MTTLFILPPELLGLLGIAWLLLLLGVATTRTIATSTQIVHIGSGASMAAGAMSLSTDQSTALDSTNLGSFPLADIALKISTTGSVSSASNYILLYRQDLNIDSTNDEPFPNTVTSTAYSQKLVGAFTVPPFTVSMSATYLQCCDVPLTAPGQACTFYTENKTNTGIGLGWTLKVTPKTDSFA